MYIVVTSKSDVKLGVLSNGRDIQNPYSGTVINDEVTKANRPNFYLIP